MSTEGQLQGYTKKEAKKLGVGFYKMICQGKAGFPDVILVHDGKTVYIELKSPTGNGKLSRLQQVRIDELRQLGATVYVLNTKDGIDYALKELINH